MGCLRPNDIGACTTAFYASRQRNCKRCKKNFHATGGDTTGCRPGKPPAGSKCIVTVEPTPTPCVLPGSCDPSRRALLEDLASADHEGSGRRLGGTFTCACDGSSVLAVLLSGEGVCVFCKVPSCVAGQPFQGSPCE